MRLRIYHAPHWGFKFRIGWIVIYWNAQPCGECNDTGLVIGPYGECEVECPRCDGGRA